MVLVKPTARWLGKTQRIPRGRKISRNGMSGTIEVSADEARHLLRGFFISLVEEEGDSLLAVQLESGVPDSLEEGSAPSTPIGDLATVASVPSNESLVIDYLNTNESEAIARQINGIGRKTADDLAMARPLEWESVQAILSDRQLEAVIAFVTTHANVQIGATPSGSANP